MSQQWMVFKNDGDDLWTIGNGQESWCRMLEHKADAEEVATLLNLLDASRAMLNAAMVLEDIAEHASQWNDALDCDVVAAQFLRDEASRIRKGEGL